MKTIPLREFDSNPSLHDEIKTVLERGGLVCHPSPSGYKLVADLASPAAITSMLQAKRRVGHAPSLVFLPNETWIDEVADEVTVEARRLIRALWPGAATLLFKASEDLHPKVRKPLTKAKGWLGVRVPDDPFCLAVVRAFGRPLLVSSANLSSRRGAHSLAQVKKNFGRTVALLVDAGDIEPAANSTLIDVSNGSPSVVRAGAVTEERILAALAG